jgi:hypothetical protein
MPVQPIARPLVGLETPSAAISPFLERSKPMEEFEALKRLVNEAEDDIRKAEGGNKAAGTRVRKQMQDIKNAAQEVRVKILTIRDDG